MKKLTKGILHILWLIYYDLIFLKIFGIIYIENKEENK